MRLASIALLSYLFGVLMIQPDTSLSEGDGMLIKFSGESVFALISLLGASIMPHNFYLHSCIVQVNVTIFIHLCAHMEHLLYSGD